MNIEKYWSRRWHKHSLFTHPGSVISENCDETKKEKHHCQDKKQATTFREVELGLNGEDHHSDAHSLNTSEEDEMHSNNRMLLLS